MLVVEIILKLLNRAESRFILTATRRGIENCMEAKIMARNVPAR